jgi:uncharacterized membrane protein YkgB
MKKTSYHILRVGVAITFLWIGVLIFKQPEAWGGDIFSPGPLAYYPYPLTKQ